MRITMETSYFLEDDTELIVSFSYTPYQPSVMYLKNGDPGYPSEGPNVDGLEVKYLDGKVFESTDPSLWEAIHTMAYEYGNENYMEYFEGYDLDD